MSTYMIYYKDGAKMMRPVRSREEYIALRNSAGQVNNVRRIRLGEEALKPRLVQMNYSCLPNADGSLKGSTAMSTTVGMDIDHVKAEEMQPLRERILAKKDELGLLMLELSARKEGYHLVFRRRAELSQEENLRWASELLGVEFDKGAKDITRVFFTTTASEEDLIFLDDEVFQIEAEPQNRDDDTTALPESPENPVSPESSGDSGDSGDTAVAVEAPPAFKGIPYSSIIREYWQRTGGEPAEGERNVKLYRLAVCLRAICDNRKSLLMTVMPRFGLTDAELKSIVDSACKEEPKGISKVIQACLSAFSESSENSVDSENSENSEDSESSDTTFHVNVRALPIGLKESLAGIPASMHMPVLCGIMPMAAAYADQVEAKYCDGNIHHLGLMTIIRGEQASNKSVVKNVVDVWKRQLDEEDALARKREEQWKERRKGRKANEKAPEDPKVLIRMVPVTVSCSTLLKRFKNASGHTLYSFGEELDTLRKTNGAGSWSSKYDIYRLSFDKGEWGQDYNSDQAESGVVKVAYNWTMLGTNGALRKCFKSDNIENGLSSRVLVSEMPDSSFQKMPKFGRRTADDEARIQEAVSRLRQCRGLVEVPRLRRAVEEWVEAKRVEAAKDIDHVKDIYRKRAAVIGFRCGVIHHLLSGLKKESKATIDFAVMMAEYTLTEQMKAFGEALRNEYVEAHDECQRYSANHSVFDRLAPTFTLEDLRALKGNVCGDAAIRKIISRWNRDGWIERIDKTHWTKRPAEGNVTL